jgi:bile acid:Na+ symporter, BASS family
MALIGAHPLGVFHSERSKIVSSRQRGTQALRRMPNVRADGAVVEIIPLWLVNVLSFTTVFSVMTAIGTTITPNVFFGHIRSPAALIRGLFGILVVVPIIGIAISSAFGLSLAEKVGITLMAIAPGAPLALRRALGSGADAGFAPTLQIAVAILAVPAVPVWVFIANLLLGTHGIADVAAVTRQVFLAQLLPLALGGMARRAWPDRGPRLGLMIGRAGAILLILAIISQIVDLHSLILSARLWPVAVAALTTFAALLVGRLLGGRSREVGHSMAIACAMRNVGLALLIATTNRTPPTVEIVIVSYAITAILIVSVYIPLRTRG